MITIVPAVSGPSSYLQESTGGKLFPSRFTARGDIVALATLGNGSSCIQWFIGRRRYNRSDLDVLKSTTTPRSIRLWMMQDWTYDIPRSKS